MEGNEDFFAIAMEVDEKCLEIAMEGNEDCLKIATEGRENCLEIAGNKTRDTGGGITRKSANGTRNLHFGLTPWDTVNETKASEE